MIQSKTLKEKDGIQAKLSEENASIQEYLVCSHLAAQEIAESTGLRLQYAEVPLKKLILNN
ncbi:MAG: hypothetical protein L0Y39_04860 [Methylococcaceae bacterium]|nr:hypothetical protein [Methylococcaceae bacterium]